MSKQILYLSYDGLTDPLGQSQILPYLFKLSKLYSFTIISFEKKENNYLYNDIKHIVMKHGIQWIPLKYTKKPLIISTIIDLYNLNTTIIKLIKYKSIDLVHARSYIVSIIALRLKKSKKIPFVFDMRGFYADERIDGKIWQINNFIFKYVYKYFKIKERQFLQLSSHIISLTFSGKKEIEAWNIPNLSPISIIPCCTDSNLFSKENIIDIRPELGLKSSDLVISYVGSLGSWYMLDEMLDFFKILLMKNNNSKFLFITQDNSDQIFEKCFKKEIPINTILIKKSSRAMMPTYIGVSNYSIFFILPFYSKKASSPTKMGEIMNLGIPIVCNIGVGDVEKIMNECMPELLVNDFNKKEYNRIINLILNNYKVDQQKIMNSSFKYYSLKNGIKKYNDIYSQLLNQTH